MDNLIVVSKCHRFDSEIKINIKRVLSVKVDENNMVVFSKKRSLPVMFDENNIIKCSKKNNFPLIDKKDIYCIKMLDEIFKKITI
jgi:hypothetical protein